MVTTVLVLSPDRVGGSDLDVVGSGVEDGGGVVVVLLGGLEVVGSLVGELVGGVLLGGVDDAEVGDGEVVGSGVDAVVGGLAVELERLLVVDVSGGSVPCGRLVLVLLVVDMMKICRLNRGRSL